MTWRAPINRVLIPTPDRDRLVPTYATHLPVPPHPGAFGVRRKHHTHEGVDLYCPPGTPVYAVEPGEIVAITPFTGPRADPPSPWWHDTDAVFVEGPSGVVVYGEIRPVVGRARAIGYRLARGESVGYVVQVLTKDKGYPMSMLHLELHVPGTRYAYDWVDKRPPSLLDPTPLLLSAQLGE